MILPTIHNNGTSPDDLLNGYRNAAQAVRAAQAEMQRIEFNARDYYPQGDKAWPQARAEFWKHIESLKTAEDYLMELEAHCYDAVVERDARRERARTA